MKTALLKRLKRLEEVRAVGSQASLEFQIGYVKKLPPEYTGERHVSLGGPTGASRANEDGHTWILRLFLARAKEGRPDYSWPEDVYEKPSGTGFISRRVWGSSQEDARAWENSRETVDFAILVTIRDEHPC